MDEDDVDEGGVDDGGESEDADDDDESPEPEDDESSPLDSACLEALVPGLLPPRSFFAQPDPLKWIVGAENCLRIVPSAPHDGQKWGPGSLIPWRMSARWSQAVQR